MRNLYDHTLKSLELELIEESFKPFNAKQVFSWIYKKRETDFSKMTDISKKLRAYLNKRYSLQTLPIHRRNVSKDGTKKYLLRLHDGHLIEAVLMHHEYGDSLCVTTQVGCNIGCAFCASGLQKRVRNLEAYEMVSQILSVEEREGLRVSHVVIMGTGEPFDNYENVMDFIDIVNSPHGLEIGARHITVSTAGLVPKIEAFSEQPKQVNLAVSLHAADNEVRSRLMKINDVYPIEELLAAVRRYTEKTNRRVTFEYLLIDGVNDSLKDANRLSDLLRGINCYVNLIPFNPVGELDYRGSDETTHRKFYEQLIKRGITATSRREKGGDIDAACGQLRIKEEGKHC